MWLDSPGLGQWLARSPVSTKTQVRDPVEAYGDCSNLLCDNLINRVLFTQIILNFKSLVLDQPLDPWRCFLMIRFVKLILYKKQERIIFQYFNIPG